VEPRHQDFLKVDSGDKDLKNLRAILLDPSCSGSGIVNSPDRVDSSDSAERLRSLASFQLLALVHSMSFPQVDYIAYSTCSVNVEEDEAVVAKALAEGNAKLEGGERWRLVAPASLRGWKRRGVAVEGLTAEQAECLCRSDPFDGDLTNGFFVGYFERVKVAGEGKREGTIGGGEVGEGSEGPRSEGRRSGERRSEGWRSEGWSEERRARHEGRDTKGET
jgi:putative methyltransferase